MAVLEAQNVSSVTVHFSCIGTRLFVDYRSYSECLPEHDDETIKDTVFDFHPRAIMVDVSVRKSRCVYIDLDRAIRLVVTDWIRSEAIEWRSIICGVGSADIDVMKNVIALSISSFNSDFDDLFEQAIEVSTGDLSALNLVQSQRSLPLNSV